ncbi:MAG: AMP-binding protein [Actinobacteria bacterium]|nr:AMP-binding protein [Actinomycetota bacterium]MBW3649009.1 AMP-binding protein [Actinomycetota bacterium]
MNLATIIEGHPQDAVAFVSRGVPTTYGELRGRVAELRSGLALLGVTPGDRVAIVSANNWLFVVSYLAVTGVGAVAVPLNPTSPSSELQSELSAVGARLAIVGPGAAGAMAGLAPGATSVERVIVPDGVELPGATPFEQLLGGEPAPVVERADHDLAVLMFTAGTSGAPRAAMLSHGNLRSNLDQMQRHPGSALSAADVCLGVLPMFHIFGLNVLLGLSLHAGASVVLIERFDPVSALESIRNHGITVVAGAPPMFQAWAALAEPDPAAMATVRLAVSGAAPLLPQVASAFEARFGRPLFQGYGLTEASPTVSSSVIGGIPKRGSIGLPLPGVEVRLVDEEGEDSLVGDAGEIRVRGPNVFAGYWEDPAASSAVLGEDGWLRTGDVAVADDDGYLYIVDRAKDLILVSGFNVYPAEVEEALLDHPGIAEVAVVGVGHPQTGETVKAFVVAGPGHHLEEDQVIDFCASRLARYKCPTKVVFIPELPHGLGGKLLRRALQS